MSGSEAPPSAGPQLMDLESAAAAEPQNAAAWMALAEAAYRAARLQQAEAAAQRAVALDPDSARQWLLLGQVLRAGGRLPAAESAFRKATVLDPGLARAWLQLSTLRPAAEAAEHLARARALAPEDPVVWLASADLARARGDLDAAADAYGRAARLSRNPAEALADLGGVCQLMGDYAGAESAYQEAMTANPEHPRVRLGMAQLEELKGRYREGLDLIADALEREPVPPSAAITGARLLRRLKEPGKSLELLGRVPPLPPGHPEAARLAYVKGDLMDELGRRREAFQSYALANRSKGSSFQPAEFRRAVDTLIEFFTAERMAMLPRLQAGEERPVFIVGMPRSGTTLLEQILGAHPSVRALGERPGIFRAVRSFSAQGLAWPGCLAGCTVERLAEIARTYLSDERIQAGDLRITDKMPGNVLHLGLVALLFPDARIIEARRDPMDTGWSCFTQDFQAESLDYTRDLAHIGFYRQGMDYLMKHWRNVLPLAFTRIEHEALVADPEAETRRLLEFLGLPWAPDCLRFHEQAPASITASFFQVREPLNARGIGRHRPYAEYLKPLEQALTEPWRPEKPR